MSSVELVEREVVRRLLRGEVAPGEWLRQDAIAAELGVSKIPVREGLQRLAAVGLVRFEPNRGATIPELTVAAADEIFALRRAVEPMLLARSVPLMSDADLAAAERALAAATRSRVVPVSESNWEFHRALYAPSRWSRALATVESLHAVVAPYVALYTGDLGGGDVSDAQHHALLDACRRRSAHDAADALDRHLDDAARSLTDFLSMR